MKKFTFILLGLLMMTSTSVAQTTDGTYHPLVREGVTWYFLRYQGVYHYIYKSPDYLYSYNFEGDTAVIHKGDMKDYKKVVYKEYDNNKNVTFDVMLQCVREESKVVYLKNLVEHLSDVPYETLEKPLFLFPYWTGEYVTSYFVNYDEIPLYDFNRESYLPDDFGMNLSHYFRKNCNPTTVTVGGQIRDAYVLDDGMDYYTGTVIEGIGIDSEAGHLLGPQYDFAATSLATLDALAWVEENGKVIYKGVMYDKAMEYLNSSAITTVDAAKQPQGVRYYNLAGVESAELQPGVNLKVTTYSDGSRTTQKIVR